MKCIHCHTDSKLKERSNGACPQCQHRFAFEPTKGDKFTDVAFQTLIDRVSSNGTVKWTDRHLYYEVVRRSRAKSHAWPWIFAALAALTSLLGLLASPFFYVVAGALVIATIASMPSKLARLSYAMYRPLYERWLHTHGIPKGLIVRSQAPPAGKGRALPHDIQHYSFDRAVVTDRPETVDLLLANNFHFENNCAILTVEGYPEPAFEVVRAMLQNNPKLTVYAVHDATPQGCDLARQLATNGWFQSSARIVDVGLSPEHAAPFKGCWLPSAGKLLPASGAKPQSSWLSHYSLELAVIRPEQIIKRLFRAMSNSAELPASDGALFWIDSGAFSSDASASDGGGDSFG